MAAPDRIRLTCFPVCDFFTAWNFPSDIYHYILQEIVPTKNMNKLFIYILSLIFTLSGCSQTDSAKFIKKDSGELDMNKKYETATLGAGCYWCVEAVFQNLKGVEKVESGFSGGSVKNPSYEEVCTGTTGHAEVAQIT